MPHSHDDVGWLKSVEEYFDGTEKGLQWTNVKVELTTVIQALLDDPKRKFAETEMKFFSMWWDQQNDEMKDKVRKLVDNGQLELINGGWSMHDEACPIYEDMIENMQIGHEFIFKNFGKKPTVGWQLDPFGHSNTNARFFSEMGFDSVFFARGDFGDKNKRLNDLEMEWVWRPNSKSLGNDIQLFTHYLYDHYCYPSGFWFDVFVNDEDVITDTTSQDYNAMRRA